MAGRNVLLYDPRVDCISPAMAQAGARADVELLAVQDLEGAVLDAADRLVVTSETVLQPLWPFLDSERQDMLAGLKDKAKWRATLAPHYPEVEFFVYAGSNGHPVLDPRQHYLCKPVEGYAGIGTRKLRGNEDLALHLAELRGEVAHWSELLKGVFSPGKWLIETFLSGELIAVDAYYNAQGKVQLLGLYRQPEGDSQGDGQRMLELRHADWLRLKAEVQQTMARLGEWLGLRDLPVHFEFIRMEGGRLVPIDLNPLRFCSAGGHNMVLDAFGLNPFLAYFDAESPDLDLLWQGMPQGILAWDLVPRDDPQLAPDPARAEAIADHYGKALRSLSLFPQPFHTLDAACIVG